MLTYNFSSYCGIPRDQLRILRWNGWAEQPTFEDAETGYQLTPTGAMKFDEESQSWRFGLRIKLDSAGWVFYGLGVADSNGKALVEVARNKPRLVDLSDEKQRNALYDYIVEVIKECYRDGAMRPAIGFSLHAAGTAEMETSPETGNVPALAES